MKIHEIVPVPKPRMTIGDRRRKGVIPRGPVARYHAFKAKVRKLGIEVPASGGHVIFGMPMPKTWSKRKRVANFLMPHRQKPDLDNLLKALGDAVYDDDCGIYDIRATKIWTLSGVIVVMQDKNIRATQNLVETIGFGVKIGEVPEPVAPPRMYPFTDEPRAEPHKIMKDEGWVCMPCGRTWSTWYKKCPICGGEPCGVIPRDPSKIRGKKGFRNG